MHLHTPQYSARHCGPELIEIKKPSTVYEFSSHRPRLIRQRVIVDVQALRDLQSPGQNDNTSKDSSVPVNARYHHHHRHQAFFSGKRGYCYAHQKK